MENGNTNAVPPATILIVDDDRAIRQFVTTILERDGYRIRQAGNGVEALAAVGAAWPDLILLDYMMPEMDGRQACAAIRALELEQQRIQPIPIVMLTGATDDESVRLAVEAGATDYLPKPVIVPVFRQRVRTLINNLRSEAAIRHMAYHDALTQLPNRSAFSIELSRLLQGAKAQGEAHVLSFLDLDQFKVVNDTCGHGAGDRLLASLAGHLKPLFRPGDTLARLGGDEFGILLRNCNMETGERVAEKLRQTIAAFSFVCRQRTFKVGASIGVVPLDARWPDASAAMAAADSACYCAKAQGRNRIYSYSGRDPVMERQQRDMDWVGRINDAMANGRLRLRRQRIAPCAPGAYPLHEVLLYLQDERDQIVPAQAFLPAAERYNLMSRIDRYVVSRTLQAMAQQGMDAESDGISINLSEATLADESFPVFLHHRLREHGVAPQHVCFEISESAALSHLGRTQRMMEHLRREGCRFSLDNFGSGLASFAALKHLQVDFIKFHPDLCAGIGEDPRALDIVRKVNELGHMLDLKTVVGFVESEHLLGQLQALGVDYTQGYASGRPEHWH